MLTRQSGVRGGGQRSLGLCPDGHAESSRAVRWEATTPKKAPAGLTGHPSAPGVNLGDGSFNDALTPERVAAVHEDGAGSKAYNFVITEK
jgi:hypothetical protein